MMTKPHPNPKFREIIEDCEDAATRNLLSEVLTLYSILDSVKFPKGTKLRSSGGSIEVITPGVPPYEIRLKKTPGK